MRTERKTATEAQRMTVEFAENQMDTCSKSVPRPESDDAGATGEQEGAWEWRRACEKFGRQVLPAQCVRPKPT